MKKKREKKNTDLNKFYSARFSLPGYKMEGKHCFNYSHMCIKNTFNQRYIAIGSYIFLNDVIRST